MQANAASEICIGIYRICVCMEILCCPFISLSLALRVRPIIASYKAKNNSNFIAANDKKFIYGFDLFV